VRRVLVLGRGGAGKSVLSRQLSAVIDVPVIELDTVFWQHADLNPLPPAEWRRVQADVIEQPAWILDGDLGPYDVLDVRLCRRATAP
jgi:adenylate kinase family enzyme